MSILGNYGKVNVLLRLCLVLSVAMAGILCRAVELTDFREPHPWNPRRWHVNAGTFADGTWTLDFANRPHADLMSSIDIPVSPKRFFVDVEADAEAAGTRLTIWTVSGGWVSRDFGTIAAASNGAKTVRQTFAIDADLTKDWKWASNGRTINPKWSRMPRPSRFLGFHVFRNMCRAAHPKIRFLSVRVEGWPENSAPEVRLVPPRGDEPPRQLGAYVINAATNDLSEGTLQVAVEDWDGHAAGTVTANVRNLKGGESRYVTLDLPSCPADKNYCRYRSAWLEDGVRKAGVLPFETSWTRPVTSEGTRDLRPELPWGMNLVLARNQPFDCFSGYEPAFDEAAFARMEQKAELARKAGVKWDRFEIQPPFLRPTKDQWNWELYDRIVDVLNRNGISGFGLVCGFPKWVKPYTEEAYRVYCETLQAIVRRYRGKMHGWEIWNEPNIHFWTGPKEEYFKLQDRAFGAVREVDPTVPVIGLSAASTPEMYDFAKKFFASGARYTEISVHTYRTGFNEGAFLDELKMLSDMGKGTRLWISEMGWTTGGNVMQTADEHAQAAYLARVYLAVAGSPHAAVMNWYDFVDDGFNFNYSEENFGILRRDLTPKPAYRAMAQIGNLFTQGKPALRKVPLAAGFALWTFTMDGKSVVWTDCERSVRAKVVLSGEAEVSNLMGEPLGRTNGAAVYSLDGEHPLFFSREVTSVEQVKPPLKSGDIRVVSLEAVGSAGQARPYLRALPPTGADVPTKLKVRLESSLPSAISPELKVTVRDWDGRVVADFVSVAKDLRSGERRIVEIDLPKLPADRNYFQFLVRNDLVESETSWTRPLADEGTRDLRPDLPWGMNVCVYRNADPTCFGPAASDDEASPAGWQRMEERAALARRCGIKWVRMEVSVKRIRPDRDTWDWEFTDRMVDALHRNGISIFGDLMWFPKWTKWFTGEAYGEYFKVVRAAAQRYRGKVLGWEIWNEPNIHFWKGTQFEYFNLITQSFYRIREVDEDVPVIGLSLSGVDVDYARAFSGRWWERFTDFSFHTYRAELDEDLFLDDIRKMSAAGKECPVWLSEMGWSTGGQAMQTCGEHDQASRLAREYMTAAGSGRVRAVCAYGFVDDGFNADYSEDRFGILRRDLTPKPSYRALASVFHAFTSGKGKLEKHLLDGGIKLWIFRMGDRAAAWTDSATPVSVTFRADGPVKAVNLMGEPLAEGSGAVTVSLDISHPVLFTGAVFLVE